MKFPSLWQRRETRESLSDIVIASILAGARGTVVEGQTAAAEVAAGYWGRAFASGSIVPDGVIAEAIQPHLGFIGRSLVTSGEAIFEIQLDNGLTLLPASHATVMGEPDPESWVYELTMSGPSRTVTRKLPAGRVLHLKYAVEAKHPWRGISPIGAAGTTRKLLENIESRLAQETGGAVGSLIPVPSVQASGQLQTDIRGLKGKIALVDSVLTGWAAGATGAPTSDYKVVRIGADPPETLARLRREAEESILASCGIPQASISGGDGAGAREQFRQFLHLTISPVALEIGRQVSARFGVGDVKFNFDALMASDLQGRARSLGSMVKSGATLDSAAEVAGLSTLVATPAQGQRHDDE